MNPSWLDLAPVPTGVIREQRIVYVNQALADLVGTSREVLVGRHFTDHVAPEDRERVGERQVRRLRGERVPRSYEFQVLRADGSRRLVEIWVSLVEGDVLFQLVDRTARALQQDKLAGLARLGVVVAAEQTEEAVFVALAEGLPRLGMAMVRLAPAPGSSPSGEAGDVMRVVAMNAPGDLIERFRSTFGVDLVGRVGAWGNGAKLAWREGSAYIDDMPLSIARFLREDAAALASADLTREAMLGRGVVLRIDAGGEPAELLILMADCILPELMPAYRLFGAQVSAALAMQRLLADLRRSYADLARAQEQLVQRERLAAIGELAAVVAHEVRNPLGVLVNSLGAFRKLLGDGVEGAARTLVEIMDEETARLNHIVHDLLDFARPSAPALQHEPLAPVIEEAVAAVLGSRAGAVGAADPDRTGDIALVREIEDLPPVPVDARLVRQAVLNIASNAVQAMPSGGTLTVRLRRDELDGRAVVRLEIEDTGTGIPEDVKPRIFEPFFTTRATGTGIGLAVVRRVVDTHRGRLRVDTAEGRGTSFIVWLPMGESAP